MKTGVIFLLICGLLMKYSDSQTNGNVSHEPPDGQGKDSNAFYALRSCHQVMHGDSGEFFSPDYLCSNPPLWCNWTIHVDPGKRVNLYLEDLSPADTCHLKLDEIHIDEPTGGSGAHRFLQRCWREARYTSVSNTLHVVLLIGGHPNPPYRGFNGRFQTFGPPIIYNPHDVKAEADWESHVEATVAEQSPSPLSQETHDVSYDYYDQSDAMGHGLHQETTGPVGRDETLRVSLSEGQTKVNADDFHSKAFASPSGFESDGYPLLPITPTSLASTHDNSRPDKTPAGPTVVNHYPLSSNKHDGSSKRSHRTPSTIRRNVDAQSQDHSTFPTRATEGIDTPENNGTRQNKPETSPPAASSGGPRHNEASVKVHSLTNAPTKHGAEGTQPNDIVNTVPDNREKDHLFEVAVEVNFQHEPEEQWDNVARALLTSLKALIHEQLGDLQTPKTLSSKRIKRLSAGVLYILWLQVGDGPEGPHVHRTLHATLQGLIEVPISLEGRHSQAVIVSVSTADVNECGTQLVLCDINAECVNRFGSYACRCRAGFQDLSQLGSGGTLCAEAKTDDTDPLSEEVAQSSHRSPEEQHHHTLGCVSGLSPELTKGVYVVFFLLSSLILLLLVAIGVLYHRRHHGAFLVRCHGNDLTSGRDQDNCNNNSAPASDLPPPPPIRRPREDWSHPKDCCPSVDLPLLRFSPIKPLDGYMEPEEGVKM